MDAINAPIRIQRNAKANHARAKPHANGRFGKQAKKVTQDVSQMGGIAKDVAQEKLAQIQDSASEYYDQGRDQLQKAGHTIGRFVREKPLKSLLIAAGVGLFVGRFWMRR